MILHEKPPRFESARLVFEPFTGEDGEKLHALYGDPRVMEIRKIGTQTRAGSQAQLEGILRHWRDHGFGLWAIHGKNSSQFVGECGLRYNEPDPDVIELAYGFLPPVWGRGYATEAAREALRFGFEDIGLRTIHALAKAENAASRRVMDKLGMAFETQFGAGANVVVRYRLDLADWEGRYAVRQELS